MIRIATGQNRVITRAQLLAAGVERRSIAHRVAYGRLFRCHPGVYLLEPPEMADRITRLTAALASYSADALLSHGSAAEVWGLLDERQPDAPIDITVVGRHARNRDRVRIHRVTTVAPIDVRRHRGVDLTSVARTIYDMAAERPVADLEQAVAVAERRGLTTASQLRGVLDRYPSRQGATRLQAVLAADRAMTRSSGERRLLELLRDARIEKPLVNARVLGYELDFLWPAARLVVELDGYRFHSDRVSFEADRRRDATLIAHGYRVLRFTGRQLNDEPLAVVARIAQALGDAVGQFGWGLDPPTR